VPRAADAELRIALAMRGGVSLAVWIGGAVQEIDQLRRCVPLEAERVRWRSTDGGSAPVPTQNVLATLAATTGHTSVIVDVLTGASAGGLNAVLYAAAMATRRSVAPLREVWIQLAELDRLMRRSSGKSQLSLLDSDWFAERLRQALERTTRPIDQAECDQAGPEVERLDVTLSVTSVVPSAAAVLSDPAVPVPEERIDGAVRLRHIVHPSVGIDYSDFVARPSGEAAAPSAPDLGRPLRTGDVAGPTRTDVLDDLALAAQSTATFPVAFSPRPVRHDLVGKLELRPRRPEPTFLYDGGVVDNMPVGKAVRAIGAAPANGPTERVLLYMHPSPGPDQTQEERDAEDAARAAMAAKGVRPFDVLRSAAKSLRGKSLADDLRQLDDHNQRVADHQADREQLLDGFAANGAALGLATLHQHQIVLDAARVAHALASPWSHVEDHLPPPHVEPITDGWSAAERSELSEALEGALVALPVRTVPLPTLSSCTIRPWGAVIRTASLLIEWSRALERELGADVRHLKAAVHDIRAAGFRHAADLNVATLVAASRAASGEPDGRVARVTSAIWGVRGPASDPDADGGYHRHDGDLAGAWSALTGIAATLAELQDGRPLSDSLTPNLDRALRSIGDVDPGVAPYGSAVAALASLLDASPSQQSSVAAKAEFVDAVRATFDEQRAALDLAMFLARRARAAEVLDGIDLLLLPLHRTEPLGSLESIRYLTVSGLADTPLAADFLWPEGVTAPAGALRSLEPTPTPDHRRAMVDPATKLAGNQLGNFSAFLDPTWRANDWMWGQLDAATSLLDVILEPGKVLPEALTADAVAAMCRAPFPEVGDGSAGSGWPDQLHGVMEGQWQQLRPMIEAECSARGPVARNSAIRSALLLRRHLELMARELVRADGNPTGAPPKGRFDEALDAWDATSRRVVDRWGDRRTTAMGMRAAFVGWKTLFARVTGPLGLARGLLAPVLAPIVGFVLARRRSIVVAQVFLAGVVAPRTAGDRLGAAVLATVAVALAAATFLATRPPKIDPATRRCVRRSGRAVRSWDLRDATSIAALASTVGLVALLAAIAWSWRPLDDLLPPGAADRTELAPYLLPVTATLVATWLAWFWARWAWRAAMSLASAAVIGGWVWLGARPDGTSSWSRLLSAFGSMWWGVIALLLVTSIVGYNIDVADSRTTPRPRWKVWRRGDGQT
jgi:patatin-related protein